MGRKRSSVNVRVTRPAAASKTVPLARAFRIHRLPNGHLGSSTTHKSGITEGLDKPVPSRQDSTPSATEEYYYEEAAAATEGDLKDTEEYQPERGSKSQIRNLVSQWLPYRQSYLDELIRLEGTGGRSTDCFKCGSSGGYKCQDCSYVQHYCQACIVQRHACLPLHRILKWTGTFYEKISLKDLGLCIQLGHDGQSCQSPSTVHYNFVVVDISGVHLVNIQYCQCHQNVGGSLPRIQLLRFQWFPTSLTQPCTAFTFDVLDTFHHITLQGKLSVYDFYRSLLNKTDGTGILVLKDRYKSLLFVSRIYRHLKLLQRTGRGHDPAGVIATLPGQCAIECPACPHPDRNLPPNWTQVQKENGWIYSLFTTIDANFRLKNKSRGIHNDPPLGDGWGHWVPEIPYKDYLSEYGYQTEPNLCESELHAVDHANKDASKSYLSTGVGGVLCRHTMVRKNGLGNLQKGERYANMDFIVFFSLIGSILHYFVFSYDIACQWFRNLSKRHLQLPNNIRLSPQQLNDSAFVIPKFHIYAHGAKCQSLYSLNFLPFMGRTNGEDPERWWAHINPVSMSTKEMGPGGRSDTIDDHVCAWNWRKITGFGTSLLSQLDKAIEMREKHQLKCVEFDESFPAAVIERWAQMVRAWNADHSKPNPYEEQAISTSMATLRLELATEEAESAKNGEPTTHDTSPSTLLQIGLDLEEQQRVIASISKSETTIHDAAELQEKRNILQRRITTWIDTAKTYAPTLFDLAEGDTPQGHAESFPLRLPSSLPTSVRAVVYPVQLINIERRLRLAQADDSLNELRRLLRVSMGLWKYKTEQVGPSQRASTRARSLIARFKNKISRCANRYRAARAALVALDPNGSWKSRLRNLETKDIKGPGKGPDEAEGMRTLSWIWTVRSESGRDTISANVDAEFNEDLRCEWAKTKARSERWGEEVMLLVEEMRRVIVFLSWKADWWSGQGHRRTDLTHPLAEGLQAYADKQSHVYRSLASKFANMWYKIHASNDIPIQWPAFLSPVNTPLSPPDEYDDDVSEDE